MRTWLFLFIFTFFQFTSYAAINIAVADFEADGVTPGEAKTLTNKLRNELLKIASFSLIERTQMETILKEQGFQNTGCVSTECIVEIGQLIGVSQIVAGSIGKVGEIYIVSSRIIDVGTGKVLATYEYTSRGSIEDLLLNGMATVANELASPPKVKPKFLTRTVVGTAQISVSAAFLKSEPSERGKTIKRFNSGTRFDVIGESGDFYMVSYDSNTCWIKKSKVMFNPSNKH
jgi:TolB-like protein